jgi:hypothetical protein
MGLGLEMPFGRYFAEIREAKVHGLPGIGGYTLVLMLHLEARRPEVDTYMRNISVRLDWGDNTQRMIGSAFTDHSQPIRIAPTSSDFQIGFRIPVSSAQIEDIERRRNGGDFKLSLWLYAELEQAENFGSVYEKYEFPVKQQEWLEALARMEYQQTLLYELPLPAENGELGLTIIKRAQYHLHRGHYDECVGECRKLLEAYKLDTVEADLLKRARVKYKGSDAERQSMNGSERLAILRDALTHATHLAHHYNESDGYSRDQAKAILGTTVALMSSLMLDKDEE